MTFVDVLANKDIREILDILTIVNFMCILGFVFWFFFLRTGIVS